VSFEVEQKFVVSDPDSLAEQLTKLGCQFFDSICQVDSYFAHPARDFAQTDEALRIRRVGEENFVTYKGPKIDQDTKTRREIELPLPTGEAAADPYVELLGELGFRHVADVRKTRRPGRIAWRGWQVEVALDEIADLGTFAELEVTATEENLADAKDCIHSLALQLELADIERRSYLELLLSR